MSTEQTSKRISSRVIIKHGLESEWNLAKNFKPYKGEIIIYDPDEAHPYPRFKVGNDEDIPSELPFTLDPYYTKEEVDEKNAFFAVPNETTFQEILNAYNAGRVVYAKHERLEDEEIPGTVLANLAYMSLDIGCAFTCQVGDSVLSWMVWKESNVWEQQSWTVATKDSVAAAYVAKTGDSTITGDLTINGNLKVSGKSVESSLENVVTPQNTITLRDSVATSLLDTEYTGIIAEKYDGTNNGMLVFDKTGTAYVGDQGDLQPLATRELSTNNKVVKWDNDKSTLVESKLTAQDNGSIIINEGVAEGISSIAGGTTDKDMISELLGGLASSLTRLHPSQAKGALSIALGADNVANTGGSIALGYDNISGGKGYYVTEINTTNKQLTLSTEQYITSSPETVGWSTGDTLFFVNENRYWLEVVSVSGNIVTVKDMPFDSLVSAATKPNERSIINIDKPESGVVNIGWGAIGIGTQNTVVGSNSYAVGYKNNVAGDFGAAFGQENIVGYSAFATGVKNEALAKASFAEGNGTTASGLAAHSEGEGTVASGSYTHAEGLRTNAIGKHSHAENYTTKTYGEGSHAEGGGTETGTEQNPASGLYAHAEGQTTKAHGVASHTEGHNTETTASYAHAEGEESVAGGLASHAEGYNTDATGYASHAEGQGSIASKSTAHAEGNGSKAEGIAAHAEGNGSTASNDYAHAEGNGSTASGAASHAEGTGTEASNTCAHAEGRSTHATNDCAHAEGTLTLAKGQFSHAEGYNTVAAGHGAHAEGTCMQPPSQGDGIMGPRTVSYTYNDKSYTVDVNGPMADHRGSHAEGAQTLAAAYASHAEGVKTTALGDGAHAGGEGTIAKERAQTAIGKYNADESTALFIIGSGTSETTRQNAFTAGDDGTNHYITIGTETLTEEKLKSIKEGGVGAQIITWEDND